MTNGTWSFNVTTKQTDTEKENTRESHFIYT